MPFADLYMKISFCCLRRSSSETHPQSRLRFSKETDLVKTDIQFIHSRTGKMKSKLYASCHEKTCFWLYENKDAEQRLCFHYIDVTIPLLPKSEI